MSKEEKVQNNSISVDNMILQTLFQTGAFENLIGLGIDIDDGGWDLTLLYEEYMRVQKIFSNAKEGVILQHAELNEDKTVKRDSRRQPIWKSFNDSVTAEKSLNKLLLLKSEIRNKKVQLSRKNIPKNKKDAESPFTPANVIQLKPIIDFV